MRLDKFLSQLNMGTRSQVRDVIRQGNVMVNDTVVKSPEFQVAEDTDKIIFKGELLIYQKFVYYMLNKPKGVVSATKDNTADTVLSLIKNPVAKDLFPVGRLDKDTEGLLIITNDGALSHRLLSPTKHVGKTYLAGIAKPLSQADREALENGVDIGDEKPTRKARVEVLSETEILLTICEGRFHQVKRMLHAVGNEVLSLKRIQFGSLKLDEALMPGESRMLTKEEVDRLQKTDNGYKHNMLQGMDAVIFDLDGSLVDSMWMWKAIDIEYLGKFGIPLPEDLQSCIEGKSFHETALYFKERFPIPDSIEKMKEDWNRMAWEKYEKEVPLKPGVKEFLQGCKENQIKLGIATSNSRQLMDHIAGVHRLNDYFECIVTGCEVERGKPSPDIYLAAAEKLQVKPSKCLVFEDIVAGIQAGKSAGMHVCAVEDAYSAAAREAKEELADYYITDYYRFFD